MERFTHLLISNNADGENSGDAAGEEAPSEEERIQRMVKSRKCARGVTARNRMRLQNFSGLRHYRLKQVRI